jgi:hypothetical protein
MGVIMIEICFYSFSDLPNIGLSGSEVVDHHHLGSEEVNENKIKHKWAIFGVFVRVLWIALYFFILLPFLLVCLLVN